MAMNLINKRSGIQVPVITPPASNLLFSSNFANTVLGAFTDGGRAFFSGTDNETSFAWPINGGGSGQVLNTLWSDVYLIRNGVAITAANASTYGAAAIQTAIGPDGTSEKILALNLTNSGGAYNAQLDVGFNRITDGAGLASPDLSHLYTSYYFKRPAALLSGLSVGQSAAQLDFKTGGHSNTFKGDFRIIQELYKGSDNLLHIRTRADRMANMDTGYDPSGILPFSGVATDSYFSKYWQEIDKSITVPVDQWNKLEIYIYRHPKNGIVLSAINDQIVCFHVGRTLGEFGYKWGRLFPFLLYSGTGDTSGEMCRPRFRDYPPAGSVLQMPASKLLDRYAD